MWRVATILGFLGTACSSPAPAPRPAVVPAAAPEPAPAPAAARPEPDVFYAVNLAYRHYAAPTVPTWVLLEQTDAPARFDELQMMRPPGSTVTGQPAVWIGEREPFELDVTLVTAADVFTAHLEERVPLGIGTRGGVTTWWLAAPIPAGLSGPWSRGEVLALRGAVDGLSVRPIASTERANAGTFTNACGVFPNLHGLTDHRDPDAMLHCFADHLAVINAWDAAATPGDETLASYRTVLFRGTTQLARVEGRFLRLLSRGDALLLLVERNGEPALVAID